MDITAYLIERELLARRSVALPFIGTLSFQRVASRFAFDRSHLIPPQNTLALAPDAEQQGDEFVELIAAEIGVTHSEAIETYNRWFASSTDETGAILTIESVCSIDLLCYSIASIDAQFAEHLTPLGSEPIAIGRPLESRGIEATSFQPTAEAPRLQILETLPIIEDVPYVPVPEPQTFQPHTQAVPNRAVRPASLTRRPAKQARPAPHNRPVSHVQHPGGVSTTALIGSIAIATIGALYIIYYLLTEYGILDRL